MRRDTAGPSFGTLANRNPFGQVGGFQLVLIVPLIDRVGFCQILAGIVMTLWPLHGTCNHSIPASDPKQ